MGKNIGAVKALQRRGLEALRRLIERRYPCERFRRLRGCRGRRRHGQAYQRARHRGDSDRRGASRSVPRRARSPHPHLRFRRDRARARRLTARGRGSIRSRPSRPQTPGSGKRWAATPPPVPRERSPELTAKILFGTAVALAATGGAAATGILPDPIQSVLADGASHFGIEPPSASGDHHDDHDDGRYDHRRNNHDDGFR